MAPATSAKSDAVAVPEPSYLDVANFDALLDVAGANVVSGLNVFGDGYTMVDQSALVGKEMLLNSYKTAPGSHVDKDTGEVRDFAIVTAVLRVPISIDGTLVNKVRFTDGGSGINRDLMAAVAKLGGFRPIHLKKGLSASTYQNPDLPAGQLSTTFYFDTSA